MGMFGPELWLESLVSWRLQMEYFGKVEFFDMQSAAVTRLDFMKDLLQAHFAHVACASYSQH